MSGREIQTVKPLDMSRIEWECRNPQRLGQSIRGPRYAGFAVILAFVGGLGGWAWIAELEAGALAQGVVVPENAKKTVQHLEGGIIRALKVREGQHVTAGQPLVVLDDVKSRSTHATLLNKYQTVAITLARLRAEVANARNFAVPKDDLLTPNDHLSAVIAAQRQLFHTRRDVLRTRKDVLGKRRNELAEKVAGDQAQLIAVREQLEIVRSELASKQQLLDRQLMAKPLVLQVRRLEAELAGKLGRLRASIAAAKAGLGKIRIEAILLDKRNAQQIADDTEKATGELSDLRERLRTSNDVLRRTVIYAPVDGVVSKLRKKTIGAVLRPGEPILDIVPNTAQLVIEARISPLDIDVVQVGLPAQVHFTAYAGMSAPRISGIVTYVSADRKTDEAEATAKPYFEARIAIDRENLRQTAPNIKLANGMPASVMIVSEKRTMIDYLWQPIEDAMRRGLRETN